MRDSAPNSVKGLELEEQRQDNEEDDDRARGDVVDACRLSPVAQSACGTEMDELGDDDESIKKQATICTSFWDRFYDSCNPWGDEAVGSRSSQSEDEITRSSDDTDIEGNYCVEIELYNSDSTDDSELESKEGKMNERDPPNSWKDFFWNSMYNVFLPMTNNACNPWNNEEEDSIYDSHSSGSTDDTNIEGCEFVDRDLYNSLIDEVLHRSAATSFWCHENVHPIKQLSAVLAPEDKEKHPKQTLTSPVYLTHVLPGSESTEQQVDVHMQAHAVSSKRSVKDESRSAKESAEHSSWEVEDVVNTRNANKSAQASRTRGAKQVRFASDQLDDSKISVSQVLYGSTVLNEIIPMETSKSLVPPRHDVLTTGNEHKFDSNAEASRKGEAKMALFATEQLDDSKISMSQVLFDSTVLNEIIPMQTSISLVPSTPPLLSKEGHSYCSMSRTLESSFKSALPPSARSRLDSWALRLRRITQEYHRWNNMRIKAGGTQRKRQKVKHCI